MSDRRTFLRGLASLSLIGSGVTLVGNPTAAAVYRTRRAHRLLDAGELEEADRLIAWLREDAERYRRRAAARGTQPSSF